MEQESQTDVKIKEEPETDVKHAKIELDSYNSELHIELTDNNLVGQVLQGPGFEYMWGGVRATHGVSKGKVWFIFMFELFYSSMNLRNHIITYWLVYR